MILSSISIRRPVLATVASVLLMVFGFFALLGMPVREYPDIDAPAVTISTFYPGASAAIVEREVTEVIESILSGVDGIDLIRSTSQDELSRIGVEFDLGRDIDAGAADVRDKVAQVVTRLPEDADNPIISKQDSDAQPVIWFSIRSETRDHVELTDFAERVIVDPMSVVQGVAQVILAGQRRIAMRVWLDRREMASRSVTTDDVIKALRERNIEVPAGRIESMQRELTVRTESRLQTPEEFQNLVVRKEGEYQIRLGEVAKVEVGAESYRSNLVNNGIDVLGIGIIAQSTANTLDVVNGIRAELEQLQTSIPADIDLVISMDNSAFVRGSLQGVVVTLFIAVVVVLLVIYLFLGSVWATLIPAASIPVSLVAAFMVLSAFGYSINTLTLLALLLAIGLVVDDAIVMLENIHRRRELGEPGLLAALKGADQVGFAIVATTLVLICVFLPLAVMGGNIGRLFAEFGVAMAAAVGFSSFIALTLAPMLSSKLVESSVQPVAAGAKSPHAWFDQVSERYVHMLDGALRHPYWVVSVAVISAVAAWGLYRALPQELAPSQDRSSFMLPFFAPEGATMEYMVTQTGRVREILDRHRAPVGEIRQSVTIIGSGGPQRGQLNEGVVVVILKPWSERDISQQALTAQINRELFAVPGVLAFAINPSGLGGGGWREPIQFVISSPDRVAVQEWGERILAGARNIPGLMNVQSDYKETKPQVALQIDRTKAADLGVNIRAIGEAIQVMFGGKDVTKYSDRGKEYDVIVQAAPSERAAPTDMTGIYVRSESTGELLPLSSFITWREEGVPGQLARIDRLPAVTIKASLLPGMTVGAALEALEELARAELPVEARVNYLGQSREFKEASGAIFLTFGLALLIVYLVLAAQFESFIHPFVIMISVPIAVTGGLLALLVTGQSFNIFSQIGLILLIGLMAKNGILIVEFANQLRDEGYDIPRAIREASRIRLRPVLMTSLATIFGVGPLVFGSGAGAEARFAVGTVVISGMTLATFMTLFIVPALYILVARFTQPVSTIERMIHELEAHEPAVRSDHLPAE